MKVVNKENVKKAVSAIVGDYPDKQKLVELTLLLLEIRKGVFADFDVTTFGTDRDRATNGLIANALVDEHLRHLVRTQSGGTAIKRKSKK